MSHRVSIYDGKSFHLEIWEKKGTVACAHSAAPWGIMRQEHTHPQSPSWVRTESFKFWCAILYMKVVCSDLLLLHLIGMLPITSPPNLWQVTLTWHTTPRQMQKGMCAEKAVREVNKHTGSSDWKLWKSKVSANSWVKAEAVSQIDYACTPLKTQTAKVPELCWIIYRLVLVFRVVGRVQRNEVKNKSLSLMKTPS